MIKIYNYLLKDGAKKMSFEKYIKAEEIFKLAEKLITTFETEGSDLLFNIYNHIGCCERKLNNH